MACLTALTRQTLRPLEILVVDNKSTDNTAELAAAFTGVRVIHEPKQGVVYARGTGFDSARGDIIARLDADTIVPDNWLETILAAFAASSVDAFSGSVDYYDIPLSKLFSGLDYRIRSHIASKLEDECFIQGTNSAIRRSAWLQVRDDVCLRGDLHEDFDLAIHLSQAGLEVAFCPSVRASISARCVDDTFRSFVEYALLNPATYAQHNLVSRKHLYPLVIAMIAVHPLLRFLYRLRNAGTTVRVNPATFVD